jgi:hypothetical protein
MNPQDSNAANLRDHDFSWRLFAMAERQLNCGCDLVGAKVSEIAVACGANKKQPRRARVPACLRLVELMSHQTTARGWKNWYDATLIRFHTATTSADRLKPKQVRRAWHGANAGKSKNCSVDNGLVNAVCRTTWFENPREQACAKDA